MAQYWRIQWHLQLFCSVDEGTSHFFGDDRSLAFHSELSLPNTMAVKLAAVIIARLTVR